MTNCNWIGQYTSLPKETCKHSLGYNMQQRGLKTQKVVKTIHTKINSISKSITRDFHNSGEAQRYSSTFRAS